MPRIPLLRSSGAGGFSPGIPLWDEGPAAAASPVAEGRCHLGDLAEVLLPWAGPSVPGVRLRGVLGVKPPQGGVVTKLCAFGTQGSCGSAGLRAEAARNCPGLSKCRAPGTAPEGTGTAAQSHVRPLAQLGREQGCDKATQPWWPRWHTHNQPGRYCICTAGVLGKPGLGCED